MGTPARCREPTEVPGVEFESLCTPDLSVLEVVFNGRRIAVQEQIHPVVELIGRPPDLSAERENYLLPPWILDQQSEVLAFSGDFDGGSAT
jgi:hypothetical protein